MSCTVVKTAVSLDPKHLVHNWNPGNNLQPGNGFKARKHEDLQGSNGCCDMRTVIITEQLAPASMKIVSSKPSFIRKSSSSKKSMCHSYVSYEGGCMKHLPTCIFVLCAVLLCVTFIFAQLTVDASIHAAVKMSSRERKLMVIRSNSYRFTQGSMQQKTGHALPVNMHGTVMATKGFAQGSIKEDMGQLMLPLNTHGSVLEKEMHAPCERETALHGLGVVFQKGTKPVHNLIIASLEDSCNLSDFRLFLRTLYRSGTMANADLVLLFPWPSLLQAFSDVLQEEDRSFQKLLSMKNGSLSPASDGVSVFNAVAFKETLQTKGRTRRAEEKRASIIWGANNESSRPVNSPLSDWVYGSVVGFQMDELDSTNSFSEFLVNTSSQLRRWPCLQMLLGLLRHRFKQVMLVDIGGVAILGDVFSHVRKKEFLYLTAEDMSWEDRVVESDGIWAQERGSQSTVSRNDVQDDGLKKALLEISKDTVALTGPHTGSTVANKMHHDFKRHLDDRGLRGGTRMKTAHDEHRHGLTLRSIRHTGEHEVDGDDDVDEGRNSGHWMTGLTMHNNAMGKNLIDGKADPKKSIGRTQSLMEMVYGKELWQCLEKVEKERKVLSSRVILGSMRSARGLSNSMVVEIVRVALQSDGKAAGFPDRALLSYLVQKSPHLLGKKVSDSLQVMENGHSMVHCIDKSKQEDFFTRAIDGNKYTVLQGNSLVKPLLSKKTVSIDLLVASDICAAEADAYDDCGQRQTNLSMKE